MISWPSMVLIGAACRNAGKTEFACRIIARLAATGKPVAGVKITVVRAGSDGCPHGGQGCGVCGSLNEPFVISSDTLDGEKDTGRMHRAGAARVYWLRVQIAYLYEGVAAIKALIDPDMPVIAESNSARTVIEPGLFLIIRSSVDESVKESCKAAMHYNHTPVLFNGAGWDVDPVEVVFSHAQWLMRLNATAVILAGGKSSRMGTDKSLLPVNGEPMIAHIAHQLIPLFKQVVISSNSPEKYLFLNLPIVADAKPDCGPLMGICSSIQAAEFSPVFVTGCDIPTMNLPFILQMYQLSHQYRVVMPQSDGSTGRYEPLFAFYHRDIVAHCEDVLAQGLRKITAILPLCHAVHPKLPAGEWYANINTPQEYHAQFNKL